jgi:protein-tyrosine phosphatase
VIDLHSHILPGIDDGANSLETALDMARAAVEDGITTLAATPHVRSDWPTPVEEMERLVAELRAALAEAEIPLELLTGGEIAFTMLPELDDDGLRRFGLGGNERYLLLELPHLGWPLTLDDVLFDLQIRGFTIVLAHPERSLDLQSEPERLERLVEKGLLVQITAAAVDGRLGATARETAHRLIDRGLAHMLASDAHAPWLRAIGLSHAADAVGNTALARWLTEEVPGAIVAAEPLPPRPDGGGLPKLFGRRS